ncbi:substrate-binding periplasmic protein [Facklamia languida]
MKHLIKFTSLCLMLVLCILPPSIQAADQLAEIKERGRILVGTSPDFPPMEFYHLNKEGDKEIVGSDIALAQAIADEIGVELYLVTTDFNGVLANLQAGTIDLGITGLSKSKEREAAMLFSKPYQQEQSDEGYQGIVMHKDLAATFQNLDQIQAAQLVVGVQGGSIQYETAQTLTEKGQIKQFATTDSAVMALNAGDVQAVAVSSSSFLPMLDRFPDLRLLDQAGYDLDPTGYYGQNVIGFPRSHDNQTLIDLCNQVIDRAIESGQMKEWSQSARELAKQGAE